MRSKRAIDFFLLSSGAPTIAAIVRARKGSMDPFGSMRCLFDEGVSPEDPQKAAGIDVPT